MNLFKNLKMKGWVILLSFIDAIAVSCFAIGLLLLCGCHTTKWQHDEEQDNEGGWTKGVYHYYVIDPNSDEPDAYFETKNEALEYKKHFAENHDYIIVKINKQYKVYNMASPRIILDN